ncbi:lytic polysaccharide monooxygenase [Amniculicola lignicola CBS 123094]|uniref:Lytic polysaccharide monooxygenase n=1 Tax=Amniculicola lignicola CBS 123094 TaxID=1392246 RepID=A0A6A5VYU4_9PLEO|nr:lytic polysaccharide monooxygenase [Amniculicola lignicola CBS 123094]
MFFNTKTLALLSVLSALISTVSGHMIMASPVPYGSPNNSPLSPDGSDYPCKGPDATVKTMNNWQAGSQQTLSFTGTAVHGGGSCQISVTLDKAPTKASKFKVIHSIEGGCPGVNSPATFPFTVPKDLPNGEYTMAWTWFNKVGNREMYMNCAPITVTGGSSDNGAIEKLPDMAKANIGADSQCKTSESFDYTFENPGEFVTRGPGPFIPLCGNGGNGGGPPAPAPTAPAPPAPAPTQAPAPPAPGPITSTVSTLVTVTALPAPKPSAAPQPPPQAPAAPGGGTCSTPGELLCNGETQFGLCNNGNVVWQPVAPGTKCQGGKIARRDYSHRNQRTAI